MQITNNLSLPEPLVRAVSRHSREYAADTISVTELIQPPQIRALTVKHHSELREDAGDRIWAMLGTLMHHALETHAQGLANVMAEQELKMSVLGWDVIGHYDLSEMVLDGELLTDYKLTSIWAIKEGVKSEWEQQLNTYAHLIRHAGRRVDQLQIVAIGRDWSKKKAQYSHDYPSRQVKTFAVPLWSESDATEYLTERVQLHQRAASGEWPECSDDERWLRGEKWAVMKRGRKRAVKLHDSEQSALQHAETAKELYVEYRPGENVRCENYCNVSEVCPQWARIRPAFPLGKADENDGESEAR